MESDKQKEYYYPFIHPSIYQDFKINSDYIEFLDDKLINQIYLIQIKHNDIFYKLGIKITTYNLIDNIIVCENIIELNLKLKYSEDINKIILNKIKISIYNSDSILYNDINIFICNSYFTSHTLKNILKKLIKYIGNIYEIYWKCNKYLNMFFEIISTDYLFKNNINNLLNNNKLYNNIRQYIFYDNFNLVKINNNYYDSDSYNLYDKKIINIIKDMLGIKYYLKNKKKYKHTTYSNGHKVSAERFQPSVNFSKWNPNVLCILL